MARKERTTITFTREVKTVVKTKETCSVGDLYVVKRQTGWRAQQGIIRKVWAYTELEYTHVYQSDGIVGPGGGAVPHFEAWQKFSSQRKVLETGHVVTIIRFGTPFDKMNIVVMANDGTLCQIARKELINDFERVSSVQT